MSKKTAIWGAVVAVIAIALLLVVRNRLHKTRALIEGAILIQDADPRRQLPISGVEVTATVGETMVQSKSDTSGFFRLAVPGELWRSETAELLFRHPGYQPVQITRPLTGQIYMIRMAAVAANAVSEPSGPQVTLKDVRVRYSTKTTTPIDVGSIAKTFEVSNIGDLPCNGAAVCSPDRKWKATIGGLTLDAGEGHEYRNARVSCIAGPCPFARIEFEDLSRGGRKVDVSVRNWSDTTTYLVEAEVVHPMVSDLVRESYPVIFGRALNFSLPLLAEGPSIEAEINGELIVFPLGPDLYLNWADCHVRVDKDQAQAYRCELKPGYRFK